MKSTRRTIRSTIGAAGGALVAAFLYACDASPPPPATSQPAAPASAPAPVSPLSEESTGWSREQAAEMLERDDQRLSAAIRLIRLAEIEPLCAPDPFTAACAARVLVARVDNETWAIGFDAGERRLRAPVLIARSGEVRAVSDGVEEELLTLHLAENVEVFPHLLIAPKRVLLLTDTSHNAIVHDSRQRVRFDLRMDKGFPYVSLLLEHEGSAREVARYLWDPYELSFAGPAADKLPDPPGGKFRLDLAGSHHLTPVGGEIPEADPIDPVAPPNDPITGPLTT